MSLLTIVQYVCGRTGVPVPSTIIGTTDQQVLQMLRLLEEEGNDLSQRGPWEGLINEASLTTAATVSQGAMTTIASNGFRYILNDTIWDRTNRLPIAGPLDAPSWQGEKALGITGPRYRYRIRGGLLIVSPTPTAGYSWYFEYVTKNWISNAAGNAYKQYFTVDSDLILIPEELVLMGLRWRWKKEKGLDYADDFNTYEMQVKNALGRDGGKAVLCMDSVGSREVRPGIFVPAGSWSL